MTPAKKSKAVAEKKPKEAKISVSESNIAKAAMRLLSQRLVSTETQYVQRVLGTTATQNDLDAQILAVRKLPWSSISAAD